MIEGHLHELSRIHAYIFWIIGWTSTNHTSPGDHCWLYLCVYRVTWSHNFRTTTGCSRLLVWPLHSWPREMASGDHDQWAGIAYALTVQAMASETMQICQCMLFRYTRHGKSGQRSQVTASDQTVALEGRADLPTHGIRLESCAVRSVLGFSMDLTIGLLWPVEEGEWLLSLIRLLVGHSREME